MLYIIAVDPGSEKTGLALLYDEASMGTAPAQPAAMKIIPTDTIEEHLHRWLEEFDVRLIICGNGTNHRHVYALLERLGREKGVSAVLTDEAHTTEEARRRYWQVHPAKGLSRLIPQGMRFPPEPVDDITAWIIGERFLQKETNSTNDSCRN